METDIFNHALNPWNT